MNSSLPDNALSYPQEANNQLLERASAGLSLQGVLVDINEEVTLQPRAKLISILGDPNFINPSHPSIDRTEEFKSQTEESRFKKVVEKFGSNISAAAEGNALIKLLHINVDIKYSQNENRDTTTEVNENRETSYYSRVQNILVPTITCVLADNQIRLDRSAIDELKRIDTQLNQVGGESGAREACRRFLQTYGSHVLLGKITFGGIYLMSACLNDFSESRKEEAKITVSKKIEAKFKLAFSGIGEVGGSLDRTSSTDEQESTSQSDMASQVCVETTQLGGSPQAENLQDWKRSLFENSNSWAVISRDELRSLGVWEIICRHHTDEFTSPQKLSELLHTEWMQLSRLNTNFEYFVDRLSTVRDRVDNLSKTEIPQWFANREIPASERLQELIKFRQEVKKSINNKAYWSQDFLVNTNVCNYLNYVAYNNDTNEKEVKELMRQLLTSDDAVFMEDYAQYKKVFDWMNKSEDSKEIFMPDIPDVDALINLISKLRQLIVEDKFNRNFAQASEATISKCSKGLVLGILNLVSELRKQDELSEITLLVLLLPFGYKPSRSKYNFQKNLKLEDYQKLVDILTENKEHFLEVFSQPENREKQEAYLLLKILGSESMHFEKEETIEFINNVLQPKLKSLSLHSILKRYNVGLSYECQQARQEIELVINPKEISQNVGDSLSDILPKSEQILPSPARELTISPPESIVPLLDTLRLSQYYPNKLGREELYTITEYSLAKNHSREPEKLSLYFLTNLLALNHQARWLDTDNKNVKSSERNEWWFDGSNEAELPRKDIHPLDVIAATFLCCQPIIRQDLVAKLWECKLAVPLVIQESEERAPKLFLWAMRGLVMRWKRTQGDRIRSEERTIADYPMETISFIRFDCSRTSKSELLNEVMFGKNPHDVFFHKNSGVSNQNRQLAEGTIELAWYLPERDQEDKIEASPQDSKNNQNNRDLDLADITAFANLRGDARKYPQQLKLIEKISSHVVIFTSCQELKDSAIQIVKNLLDANTAIILVLTNEENIDKGTVGQFMTNFSIDRDRVTLIDIIGKSKPEICNEVRSKLKSIKSTPDSKISLADLGNVVQQEGMEVDEEETFCQQGINEAKEILKLIRQYPKEQRKDELLPLQNKYWKEWAQADKETSRQKLNRSKEDRRTYADRQNERKAHSRQQQINTISEERLPIVTKLFLKALLREERQVREYLIRQLKLGLDALSREELPHLYDEYRLKMKKLGEFDTDPTSATSETEAPKTDAQRDQELEASKKINQELKAIDKQITAQSFGLEHLLREIGQVYIALKGIEEKKRSHREQELFQKLPRIVAELLLSGYPLEIMDGEVSCVPLEWVQAVLEAFKNLVQQQGIENPRIFALSAMGIQSSGKSTLLNVMFGLQFAVSAGRCTKGIYLQPVKLGSELREKLQVDYIFVVDTEGIKSPEQSLDSERGHDNELSTFVIGLSDLSLIKVSGENSEYLKDILPISVQAFLRMNKVNLKPKTKIVHRNVDTSSTQKLDQQTVSLNHSLDKCTEDACREERQPVQRFSDIIEFDLKKDVEYLGTLYKGIASRNPIDSDYSKSVKKLTGEIINGITKKNISSVDKFIQHLESLWTAVKSEDFIYEFKNTAEIQARNKLNACWGEVVQEFGKQVANLVSSAYAEINNCNSIEDLLRAEIQYEERLSKLVDTTRKEQQEKIENFFKESEGQYDNSMNKWETSTITNLDDLRDDRKKTGRKQIQNFQAIRQAELERKESCNNYRKNITKDITVYVQQQKQGKSASEILEISEDILREKFEALWLTLLQKIDTSNLHISQSSILLDTENILDESYKPIYKVIKSSLDEKSKTKDIRDCNVTDFHIKDEYYNPTYGQLGKKFTNLVNPANAEEIKKIIETLKDDLLKRLNSQLEQREAKLEPYEANYLRTFLREADLSFNKTSNNLSARGWFKSNGCDLTNTCKADLFMIICGQAIRRLEEIDEKWREAQDPIIAMEKEKEDFWRLFLTMFHSTNFKSAVTGVLINCIQTGIIKKIVQQLPDKITATINGTSGYRRISTKNSLIASKMIDLAEKENFDDYIKYIDNPKTALQKWIAYHVDAYNKSEMGLKGLIAEGIDTLVEAAKLVIKETNKSIETSSEDSRSVLDWKDKFSQIIKRERLIISDLDRVDMLCVQFSDLSCDEFMFADIDESLAKIRQQLIEDLELNALSRFENAEYEKLTAKVTDELMSIVLGCVEACPFCGEICSQQRASHDGITHATSNNIHRPKGLRGWKWESSQILVTDTCSQLVAGEAKFLTENGYVPYQEYRTVHPTWDIQENLSLDGDAYWKWFMCRYRTELAQERSALEPDIPAGWSSITKEKALEKLRQIVDGKG